MKEKLSIEALEDLGVELERAERRSDVASPRWRRPRQLRSAGVAAVASLAVVATAAAGVAVVTLGDPVPEAPAGDFTADQRPLAGSEKLSGVRSADPESGPDWALRLFRSETGRQCYAIGRVLDGRFGTVSAGVFRELPLRGPGTCPAPMTATQPLAMEDRRFVGPGEAPRTVIAGIASSRVDRIELRHDGKTIDLRPDDDGAFLAVFEGVPTITRVIHFVDGTTDVLTPRPFER